MPPKGRRKRRAELTAGATPSFVQIRWRVRLIVRGETNSRHLAGAKIPFRAMHKSAPMCCYVRERPSLRAIGPNAGRSWYGPARCSFRVKAARLP